MSFIRAHSQFQLIVYNIPRQQAIDFVQGHSYKYIGDEKLEKDPSLFNFYLKPSRTLNRSYYPAKPEDHHFFLLGDHRVMIVADDLLPEGEAETDILILSQDAPLSIHNLSSRISAKKIVIDCSNSTRKAREWAEECNQLNIPVHNVSVDGAFVMKSSTLTFAPR